MKVQRFLVAFYTNVCIINHQPIATYKYGMYFALKKILDNILLQPEPHATLSNTVTSGIRSAHTDLLYELYYIGTCGVINGL